MLDLDAIEKRNKERANEFAAKFPKVNCFIGDTLECHEILALITELRAARDVVTQAGIVVDAPTDLWGRGKADLSQLKAALQRYDEAVSDAQS